MADVIDIKFARAVRTARRALDRHLADRRADQTQRDQMSDLIAFAKSGAPCIVNLPTECA